MVNWVETKTDFFKNFLTEKREEGVSMLLRIMERHQTGENSVNSFFCHFELNTNILLLLLGFRAQSGKLNCFKDAVFTMQELHAF